MSDPSLVDEKIRYETLSRVEELLTLWVARYGRRTTLGELLAIMAAMKRLCHQDRVTIAEISEATGLPKQSLSRWAQKRVGDTIELKVNEDDQRVHDVVLLDKNVGAEPLREIARIMGVRED